MFGKLTLAAIPHEPIILGAGAFMGLCVVLIIGALFYFKRWKWLWTEWLTTVDAKKIGVMYFILAVVMLLRGFADALLMRSQQALAAGSNHGYLPPFHYDQIYTAHGVIMIFFMAMPFMFALLNWIVPLQIGARDVAFPFLNSFSFWLTAAGAILVNISLVLGEFAKTGWLAYPPLSELMYSPGVGVDYYIWSLQISGLGTLLAGINFIVTILKMRCPGMTLMKMPVFTWSALCSMILVAIAFPVLTVTLGMLALDRYMDMHFFTSDFGGNQMMYVNMIWAWGHPEVYILVLPAFGIYSEVVSTFAKKRLFGYKTMVWALAVITILSFMVWLHHFFTMGAGANVNAFFGITTMIISIPTGVKIFNWLFTMYRGRITYSVPMLWTMGFLFTFVIGGMTGVLLSVPGADFELHNSVFLIAHFHNTIIGGVVFGYLAGLTYWFPKIFGFKLNPKLGKLSFWCWLIGFYIAFMPAYLLGFMGMTRRINHYDAATGWQPFLVVEAVGAVIIGLGILFLLFDVITSTLNRKNQLDITGDPWDGRTLEWSTSSPPPLYNFAFTPHVNDLDPFWEEKQRSGSNATNGKLNYQDIHMPKNTGVGFILAGLIFIAGFATIWHIWWLVIAGGVGTLVTLIYRAFDYNTAYYLKAENVEKTELEYLNRKKQ
ncbi:MAG: cytochrome o ubiquinol oxidase subunit I [Neisseriaceae bacterium]